MTQTVDQAIVLDTNERVILEWLITQKMPTCLEDCFRSSNLPEAVWAKAIGQLRQKKLIKINSRSGAAPLLITRVGREAVREV